MDCSWTQYGSMSSVSTGTPEGSRLNSNINCGTTPFDNCSCAGLFLDFNNLRQNDYDPTGTDGNQLPLLKAQQSPKAMSSSTTGKFADHPFVSSKCGQSNYKFPLPNYRRENGVGANSAKRNNYQTREAVNVEKFLLSHPKFLTYFVNKNINTKTLGEWSKSIELRPRADNKITTNVEGKDSKKEDEMEGPIGEVGDVADSSESEKQPENDEDSEEDEKNHDEESDKHVHPIENQIEDQGAMETNHNEEEEEEEEEEKEEPEEVEVAVEEEEEEIDDVTPEHKIIITATTSTTDAMISPKDLLIFPMVSASTSTTNGLIITKPQILNPKVALNLTKLNKIREARNKQNECVAKKARKESQKRMASFMNKSIKTSHKPKSKSSPPAGTRKSGQSKYQGAVARNKFQGDVASSKFQGAVAKSKFQGDVTSSKFKDDVASSKFKGDGSRNAKGSQRHSQLSRDGNVGKNQTGQWNSQGQKGFGKQGNFQLGNSGYERGQQLLNPYVDTTRGRDNGQYWELRERNVYRGDSVVAAASVVNDTFLDLMDKFNNTLSEYPFQFEDGQDTDVYEDYWDEYDDDLYEKVFLQYNYQWEQQ